MNKGLQDPWEQTCWNSIYINHRAPESADEVLYDLKRPKINEETDELNELRLSL